jgi:hypothetical protein
MSVQANHSASKQSDDFLILDRALVAYLDGSIEAALLYQRIQFRAGADGWWQPESQAAMFAEACLTEWKGKAALKVLRAHGLVESERVHPRDPSLRYRVGIPPSREGGFIPQVREDSSLRSGRIHPASSIRTSRTQELSPAGAVEDVLPLDLDPCQPALKPLTLVPPDCDEGFDEWWSLYPKKVGKQAARRRWGLVVRDTDPGVIMAGLRAQLPSLSERERRFVPDPATWLNAGRWEDEVSQPSRWETDPWRAWMGQ